MPRGGALGGEQGGDPETVREEGYREDEKEFGLGGTCGSCRSSATTGFGGACGAA